MVDTIQLRKIMKEQGYRDDDLADAIGLTSSEFARRMSESVFGTDEIEKMIEILKIEHPESIFFK
ncbi:DUF739 domain-containing protein [Pseudoramibacter porci]|uniref:DUF739 domain-containing protein n=1 Tax=Pseudoramibacter porci TaxID=2606631 RepID=A0A7X2NFZ2_9FIRM|nr:DUF739 domain-containing protein [Pseudoramibacter porci]MSS19743.1 DUF739 domain-containing protein [Pseudoramibacter porci]